MLLPRILLGLLVFAWFNAGLSSRAEEAETLACAKSTLFLAPMDSSDHRKYAPDREIDIVNLALDVTPDFKKHSIAAKAAFTFKPIAQPLRELRLDAVDLDIQSVISSEKIQGYQATGKDLVVTFADPVPTGREISLTIAYTAEPKKGLYFRTPEMGYKAGDTHLFTQGEAIEARHWYPCFDAPNEKFTSEITCHVPEGMTVLSNGKLLAEDKESATGLWTVHWRQDKPHATYLMSLVAGYFKKVEDTYRDIPLAFYTPASEIEQAGTSFRDTKDAMAFFEREIGVPYPWAESYQVCVNDFVAGGMENTSITTLTDGTLFTDASENIHNSEGLVAHELAHQWFGDLVTCKDWSHLWLNEGFATYYADLYTGHKNGRDSMLFALYQSALGITERTDDTKAIVQRQYDSPDEQFSYLAYPKGGWVLHMLRSQLGEDLYRRCIKTYLERHQYQNVVTEDLNSVIEELSGRSCHDRFFDQWVYHAHHPELEIKYAWDEPSKLAKVSISQNQKLSDSVLLFQFPLTVRFKTAAETIDRQITVKEKAEDFYFALPEMPKFVRIDPELTLLAKINFSLPEAMLEAQLAQTNDVVGRLLAVEKLAAKKDRSAIDKLKGVLQHDPFYGLRLDAARALLRIHSDEAFEALAASLEQPDARVRQQVMMAATAFYRTDAYDLARKSLDQEKNPDIRARILRGLAPYATGEVRSIVVPLFSSDSFRNRVADAAISAARSQDDPAYIAPLQKALLEREASFTSSGFGRGLETLSYLARNEEKKEDVRAFCLGYVNHHKKAVQLAALRALGMLGDPKAIPVLETFAGAAKESPEREAAEKAIVALRAAKKPNDEWRDLRSEVLELKNENRDLKKQFDDLKKRVDGAEPKPAETSSKKKAGKRG